MKIGALIPIRLSSERLPKKAIRLIEGKPAVYHLLDRAFESKYLDRLIAPYPSDIAIWQERSPINNIDL